jgi:hypothetical protein
MLLPFGSFVGGTEMLDGVVSCVEHRQFHERFEQDDGDGRRRDAIVGERL